VNFPTYPESVAHSKVPLKPKKGRAKWTKWTTEDITPNEEQ